MQPVTQRLGAAGRKAQSINTIKGEQATNEVRREKKSKERNGRAKKGWNNDKPNQNGVSVLDRNLSLAREPAEAWLDVCVTALC